MQISVFIRDRFAKLRRRLRAWSRRRRLCSSRRDFALKVFYVICTAIFMYETAIVIIEYFRQPVNTTISFNREEKQEPLPYIQVCSQYWVDKRQLSQWNMSDELFEYIKEGFLGFNNYKGLRKRADLTKLNRKFRRFLTTQPKFDYRTFFSSVALRPRSIMPYCKWQEKRYDCDQLFERILTPSGFCFLLRPEKAPKQLVPGPAGGLRFLITRKVHLEPDVIYNTGFDDGIHLSISGQWQPQLVDPLFIATGKRAYLQIYRTKFDRVSGCTMQQRLTLFQERYSQAACLYECLVNYTLQHCNCTWFTYNVALSADRFCTPRVFRRCIRPLLDRIHQHSDSQCLKDCPRRCTSDDIRTSASYARNDIHRVSLYNKRRNKEWDSSETIMVHVYYSQIGHTLIEEHWTITVATVLSNIGGQVGLWLGFSALSFSTLLKRNVRLRIFHPVKVIDAENGTDPLPPAAGQDGSTVIAPPPV